MEKIIQKSHLVDPFPTYCFQIQGWFVGFSQNHSREIGSIPSIILYIFQSWNKLNKTKIAITPALIAEYFQIQRQIAGYSEIDIQKI